ncbi:prepilin-type N-terminal cleavage/methylation domain-containing protein [Acaryochloris marina]|uniref:type IV pilus modification PilV family protein n=1 Tax=Acaryochloris marina TaxID=155978 RepID=UPI002016DE77|nr:type II secretion system protein [Acaryochloris marina]
MGLFIEFSSLRLTARKTSVIIRTHKKSHEQGFTLVEVAVAMLVMAIFIGTAMQGLVLSTTFKVRAKQLTAANNWIQQDLEDVKAVASDVGQVPLTSALLYADALPGDTTIQVTQLGFRPGDSIVIGTETNSNVITNLQIQTDPITGTNYLEVTLLNPLAYNQKADSTALVLARCRSHLATGGFAAYLDESLPAVKSEMDNSSTPKSGQKTILGQEFTLQRTTSVRPAEPYQILEVTYNVTDENLETVAQANSEVVPNAFFACP